MTHRTTASGPGRIDPGLMAALGFVAMAGSMSTDVYLPAFPDLVADLRVPASAVQFTMTSFLIGSAVGQLFIGGISDAIGRRRTLLGALAVFVACAYLAAASPNLAVLVAVRAVQGFAGSAGAVLARAIVADLAEKDHAVKAFSALWAMIALGPAIAQPLGALLTQVGGWRTTLLGVAVITTAMLVVAALVIPESLPPERRHPLSVRTIAVNMGRLLADRTFLLLAVGFGATYGGLIVYLSSSSFIVQSVFGLSPFGYALTFSFTALCIMSGSWLSGRLALQIGTAPTLRIAQALVIVSSGAALLLALGEVFGLGLYLALMGLFGMGCGAAMATGSAIALGRATATAGSGSAIIGFFQFTFGASASPLGGIAGTDTAVPAMAFMCALGALSLIAGLLGQAALRRSRRA